MTTLAVANECIISDTPMTSSKRKNFHLPVFEELFHQHLSFISEPTDRNQGGLKQRRRTYCESFCLFELGMQLPVVRFFLEDGEDR